MTKLERTQVAVIGAGPAGLLLGRFLDRCGIDNIIVESRTQAYCEGRIRAGILEYGTTELLAELGAAERLQAEGLVHGGIELRFAGEGHRIAMDELTSGRTVTVYGQTEVVKDLIGLRQVEGGSLRFSTEVVAIEDYDMRGARPVVRAKRIDGSELAIEAQIVVAADGFHGVGRRSVDGPALTTRQHSYPYAWLGILADVAPSCDELIYCHHDRGFALHSMRSPTLSRLYIQVDPNDRLEDWSDERVWDELATRLTIDGWNLKPGPVLEKSITPMRSFVASPMRHGNLFLAGDAAHIVPPTGAKGLNLAASDIRVLGPALAAFLRHGDGSGLESYSDTCLRRVWRAQDFSYWMTTMLHRHPNDADSYFADLQRARLAYVCSSESAARTLAENYVGLSHI
jgi:p-hydroxybenzoate 3-monooxygenase